MSSWSIMWPTWSGYQIMQSPNTLLCFRLYVMPNSWETSLELYASLLLSWLTPLLFCTLWASMWSWRSMVQFISLALSCRKGSPVLGLVLILIHIYLVGKCLMFTLPCSILSVMKKRRIFPWCALSVCCGTSCHSSPAGWGFYCLGIACLVSSGCLAAAKVKTSHHHGHIIVHPNQIALTSDLCVYFLLIWSKNHGSLSKCHHTSWLPLVVPMHIVGGIDEPYTFLKALS